MIRILDKNGCEFFSVDLTGLDLFRWYNKSLGTEIFQVEGGRWVASYASLIFWFGSLRWMEIPIELKYVIEIVARKYNYLDFYNIKPFFYLEELDQTTVIFTEFDFPQYQGDTHDRQFDKNQNDEARLAG
jgi:hypothetical protein